MKKSQTEKYLRDHGYDGLYNTDSGEDGCGCAIAGVALDGYEWKQGDLYPCDGEPQPTCKPGVKVTLANGLEGIGPRPRKNAKKTTNDVRYVLLDTVSKFHSFLHDPNRDKCCLCFEPRMPSLLIFGHYQHWKEGILICQDCFRGLKKAKQFFE